MNKLINNKKKSEILCEHILELNYGEVLLHQDIEQIIGEDRTSNTYKTIISQTKNLLLKNRRAIESIKGQGYRVVEPDRFVELSLNHYHRGFKEFKKGTNTLNSAPVKDMSNEGRTVYQRVSDRAAILQALMNGVSVELKTLAAKEHPFAVK